MSENAITQVSNIVTYLSLIWALYSALSAVIGDCTKEYDGNINDLEKMGRDITPRGGISHQGSLDSFNTTLDKFKKSHKRAECIRLTSLVVVNLLVIIIFVLPWAIPKWVVYCFVGVCFVAIVWAFIVRACLVSAKENMKTEYEKYLKNISPEVEKNEKK